MSKNINQIFISNPATTMQNNDLMYLGRSPYGLTNDMAILWSNIISSLGGTFLEKANNLSDLSNQLTAYQNFGLGARSQITYTDADFPVVLTNPCPNIITLNCSSPGHVLQLPDAQGTQSFELFNGPEIINLGTERVNIVSFLGIPQTPSQPNSDFDYLLTDKSTTGGIWDPRGHVTTVNGQTGNVLLKSPSQLLFVSNDGNDSTGTGSILAPFATYEFARAFAVSAGASAVSPYCIIPVGLFNITGNFTVSPYVNIMGQVSSQSIFNLTGGIVNDTSWYTTDNAETFVSGCAFIAPSGLSAIFNVGNGNTINYTECDFTQVPTLFTSTTNTSTFGNLLVIQNSAELDITIFGGGSTVNDTNLTVIGNDLVNVDINATGSGVSNGSGVSTILSEIIGTVNVNSSGGTGAFAVFFASSSPVYATVNLNGVNTAYGADASSYFTVPTFSGGASISNVQITSLADSIAQTTYTPINYTPISPGNNFPLTSVTANLAGIDAALSGSPSTVYQQLYVNDTFGNDSNSGSIEKPMKTYEAARLQAISLGASLSTPFVINMIGVFSITGNMTISPYVSVIGTSDYSTRINFTGNIVLDFGWNSFTSPFCMVRGINFIGSLGINFIYSVFQSGSFIRFENCSLQFSSIGIVGSGTNTACETVVFNNCNTDLSGEPSVGATNVNLYLFNTNPSNNITVSCLSATTNAKFVLTGSQTRTGNILLDSPSTGTLNTIIGSSNTFGKTLEISGSTNTVTIDSTSYQFTLILNGGATLSNLVTPTKTDGMVNTSYTPTSYTPTAGGLFAADTLTGNLKGIDIALATAGGGVIPSEWIFVDAINGNDSNSGAISSPLLTYEAARLLAVSRNPQYATGQTILLMTSENITGDMTISPFVSVVGLGKYCTIVGISGNMVLDTSWGTTSTPTTNISNISFVGTGLNFVYSAFQGESVIRFENCEMQWFNGTPPTATFTGSDGSGTTEGETVIFLNCTLDLIAGISEPEFITNNINLYLLNTSASSGVNASVSSATVTAKLLVENSPDFVGNITVNATSTGTLTTEITSSNTLGSTLTINGTSNTVYVDASSYQFSSLVFSGGASLSNILLPSLTDGLTNSSYSPVNYITASGSNFKSSSLTGNLKGIDNKLPQTTFNGMAFGSALNATSVVVLGSHETKIGSMVTGSIIFSFTSTSILSPVIINFSKSYGNNFSSNIYQAIGSGICAATPTTAIGDASVQNIQASFPLATIKIFINTVALTDYIAEVVFTYQVT